MWRNWYPYAIACGNVRLQLWKTIWWLLKKSKHEITIWPAILLLGLYTKELNAELNTGSQRDLCASMVTASLLIIDK